ncbi:histone-lysine N-methyltransferase Set2 [Eurosta solidaginis]|uniref:histone-lysine N-methyltransferase Set2 n=1 Tax=Eurosta solidaginis TaxID=178769 RepID=UPI0035310CB9
MSKMNTAQLTAAQRKRGGGRATAKTANTTEQSYNQVPPSVNLPEGIVNKAKNRMENKNILEIDGAAIATSPTSATAATKPAAPSAAAVVSAECRRSSRKKIIKFDVRDLLNKHRKPHKIQIEARIDSNAPQTLKPNTASPASMGGGGNNAGTSSGTAVISYDLSSKQKAFMEKSAIFRRMSISEQQNKIISTPPLPPPLSTIPKIGDILAKQHTITNRKSNVNILSAAAIDPVKIAQARRLSRTQEIFNVSLMKSKQNSSLIVAQIENNNNSSSGSSGLLQSSQTIVTANSPTQQTTTATATTKRKSVSNTSFSTPTLVADTKDNTVIEMAAQKRRGRSLKSKVTTTPVTTATKSNQKSKTEIKNDDDKKGHNATEDTTIKATSTNTARNWKEYKANLAKSNESLESNAQKRLLTKNTTPKQNDDVILEVSSTSSASELEFTAKQTTNDINDAQQRNYGSVCIWQKSSTAEDEKAATEPEFTVGAVEEVTTENSEMLKESKGQTEIEDNISKPQNIFLSTTTATTTESTINTAVVVDLNIAEHKEIVSNSAASTPPRASSFSRKSSGSESESGSDRSNKSYKKGDKLRISLKRFPILEHHANISTISMSSPSGSRGSSDIVADGDSDSSSPTSSNNNDDNNVSNNEKETNKVLRTRRSHRLPLRNTTEQSTTGNKSQTKTKQNLKPTTITTQEAQEKEVNDNALPVDLNATKTAVKTDNNSELSKTTKEEEKAGAEEKIVNPEKNLHESSEMLIARTQVEKIAETYKKQIKDSTKKEFTAKGENEKTLKPTKDSILEISKAHATKVDNKDEANTIMQLLDEQTATGSQVSHKRERRITLPLKKQVSKFKMYEEAVQDVAANVETSTLLDILNTVKQNYLTTSTATKKVEELEAIDEVSEPLHKEAETNIRMSTSATNQTTEINAAKQATKKPLASCDTLSTASGELEHTNTKMDDVQGIMPDVALEIEIDYEDDNKLDKISTETQIVAAEHRISEIIANVESQNLQASQPVIQEDKDQEKIQSSSSAASNTIETTSTASTTAQANITHDFSVASPTKAESPTNLDEQSICSDLSSDKTYDESSSEGMINTKSTRKGGNKKTPSPTPSTDSLRATKKPMRRYERRSQRGTASAHKTLEETFAEIAAESSKAVLELKAKRVEEPNEGDETAKDSVLSNVRLAENTCKKSDEITAVSTLVVEASELKKMEEVTTQTTIDEDNKIKAASVTNTTVVEENKTGKETGTAEMVSTTDTSTDEILNAKMDLNLTKGLHEDVESNSNHSSPSRRTRRTKNKKSPASSPTTVTVSQNAKTQDVAKVIEIENENVAAINVMPSEVDATEFDLQVSQEVAGVEEVKARITRIRSEHTTNPVQIVERTEKISAEIPTMSATEPKSTLSQVIITDDGKSSMDAAAGSSQQQIKTPKETESDVQLNEVISVEVQQQQVSVENKITVQSPTVSECAIAAVANEKTQNQSLSPSPGKSRKPKKSTSPKLKKTTKTESEEKGKKDIQQAKLEMGTKENETDKASDQVDDGRNKTLSSTVKQSEVGTQKCEMGVKPEAFKSQTYSTDENIASERHETLQTPTDNVLENIEINVEAGAAIKKIETLPVTERKVEKTASKNVHEKSQEQQQPIDNPAKKVKKRKSTKATNDDTPATAETIPQLQSVTTKPVEEGDQTVETKAKNAEKEDTPGKVRKSRKGKHSPDLNQDNVVSVTGAEIEIPAESTQPVQYTTEAEVEANDVLAKAPPKKRLLKLQLLYEEKATSAANATNIVELPTTSSKSSSATVFDGNKTKEKKTKKDPKTTADEQATKRSSFDNQTEPLFDEESRSANSTPVSKRFKQQKTHEKTPEEKTKAGSKRKSKWDQQPAANSAEKDNKSISPTMKSSSVKNVEKKKLFLQEEPTQDHQDQAKRMEEKSAKKKRQKKLKEAFEAALNDALGKQQIQIETSKESYSVEETTKVQDQEERVVREIENVGVATTTETKIAEDKEITTEESQIKKLTETSTMIEPEEEDPDPLKDIEKFIEDGVNLLKRGYKMEDDSVDEVICTKTLLQKDDYKKEEEETQKNIKKLNVEESETEINAALILREGMITPNESINSGDGGDLHSAEKSFDDSTSSTNEHTPPRNLYYETPADTPVATPTSTPPPKSPTNDSSIEEISGVRRSHRIKLITKTPKALVGRGLVREKERFSIKDDVEMKTHYSLDDHLTDLAQVEAKNAKFLKEMEERLSNFQVIKENEYKCERVISREARKMLCDCFLTTEEEERGELGCGEDCLNRLLMIECGPDCNVKYRCTNKRFQKTLCSPCRVFRTEKKGFGIMADIEILPGEFIMEYVGEVINGDEFEQRRTAYSLDKNRHYYFMALRSDAVIDATIKGNISRFINHSCDPNAETQKWTVNGELRIGFFSRKSIMPGEEITFDYQYQRYGREAQRCYCEAPNCLGWIGEEPNSDEGEQVDEDSDALADVSEEDESDDSIADAEEAQKNLEIEASASKTSAEYGKIKLDEKADSSTLKDKKKKDDADDDTKAKLKKLAAAAKSADKASRKKSKIKEKKAKRLRRSGTESKNARFLEDPDIEDEVKFLSRGGLRNQSDTLRFSRLVVRAKLPQTRLNLLKILRNAELPCRRLFLDYHGLRLLHGWMIEDGGDMTIRLALLEALESLPIANKTVLTDSKVYQSVRNWGGSALTIIAGTITGGSASSPSDESSKESTSSNSMQQDTGGGVGGGFAQQEVPSELQKLALKLTTTWNSLPEIFRIPKRERIEQMKEHEREADRQYAAASVDSNRSSYMSDRYQRDRFGRGPTNSRYSKPSFSKENRSSNIAVLGSIATNDPRRRAPQENNTNSENMKHLSKEQRREMFAAKVARDEAEKRLAEERREFETKCRFFGLDPKKTHPQDVPFCVDPSTGQWFSVARQPIPTPPCYAHIQVQPKPKSLDPADYKLPAVVATLPPQWKFAITTLGQIYYYHQKQRVPQWHPPTPEQLRAAAEEADSTDSESCEEAKVINESSEDDEILIGMDEAKLMAFIDKRIEHRRNKRYNRLVDTRPISPRKEEDRIYNQMEMRKYKENKEKIRKRKEDIRRKRAEAHKTAVGSVINPNSGNVENLNTDAIITKIKTEIDSDEPDDAIPIQDYLLSSDEEEIMKAECNNSPLLDKIVQGDKIVDELDALTTKRALKRPLPPHRDLSSLTVQSGSGGSNSSSSAAAGSVSGGVGSGGGSEHKRRKSDKKDRSKKSKDSDSKYRRNKEKFRCEIAGIIVQHLKPYRKDSCALGRIQSDEDFNHLARKLTHFVMVKELKYCEAVGQTLVVTESVKNKSREFIKKYMAKYGGSYVKPVNDPEFKDIPFTI